MPTNGGLARIGVVFTAIGELGRGLVSTSRTSDFSKTDQASAQEETGGQCLPRVCPDGQGGQCGREV